MDSELGERASNTKDSMSREFWDGKIDIKNKKRGIFLDYRNFVGLGWFFRGSCLNTPSIYLCSID